MSNLFSSPKQSKPKFVAEDFSKFGLIGFLRWYWKKIVLFLKRNKEFFKCAGIMLVVYILTIIALSACDVL